MMTPTQTAGLYDAACTRACNQSRDNECTQYVLANVRIVEGYPAIVGFTVSDWYDNSVVCSYTCGKKDD